MYHLRVESGPKKGEAIPLPIGEDEPIVLSIGRGSDANLRFADSTISRRQAELRWEGGAWFLLNLSRHGSYVGRKLLAEGRQRKLKPGDVMLLGETKVMFGIDPNAVATPGTSAYTPQTPTIAAPPTLAGYDTEGHFHSGQTLMNAPEDPQGSFVFLLGNKERGGLKVKTRQIYFLGVLFVMGVVGCVVTGVLIALPTLKKHPTDLALATLVAFLPVIPYMALIKFLDRNDQIPWKNIVACAVWGGTVGCGFSLILNTTGSKFLGEFLSAGEAYTTTAILIAPLVEEIIKGMAVFVLFMILHDEFDNALEGLILGAASGLGFALIENCVYNVRFLSQGGSSTLWVMGTYRMVVNALIGHPIYTAMTGIGLGLLRETAREKRIRYLYPFIGLGIAIAMHVAWNAAAVYLGKLIGDKTGVLTLIVNALLLGGSGLLFFVAAYVFAARRERRVLVAYLAPEVDKGFVDREELDSFHQALGRLRYEIGGFFSGGYRVYRERKALRRAQVELAFRKWHLARGDRAKGADFDRVIKSLRNLIRDKRNLLNSMEGIDRRTGREIPIPELTGVPTMEGLVRPPPETGVVPATDDPIRSPGSSGDDDDGDGGASDSLSIPTPTSQ